MTPKKVQTPYMPTPIEKPNYVQNKSKFEVYGEEIIEKEVKQGGNSGRVYVPHRWIGTRVKIIKF